MKAYVIALALAGGVAFEIASSTLLLHLNRINTIERNTGVRLSYWRTLRATVVSADNTVYLLSQEWR